MSGIEIWSAPTATGFKIHIVLEELGLAYTAHPVDMMAGGHRAPALLAMNPLGRIPVLLDPDGPDGAPLALGETGAIVDWLARKTGRMGGATPREAVEISYWSHAVSATLAPLFQRQFWLTVLAPEKPPSLIAATLADLDRALGAFEARLDGRDWLVGTRMSVADALLAGHLFGSAPRLARDLEPWPALQAWRETLRARPAVQRALTVLAPEA